MCARINDIDDQKIGLNTLNSLFPAFYLARFHSTVYLMVELATSLERARRGRTWKDLIVGKVRKTREDCIGAAREHRNRQKYRFNFKRYSSNPASVVTASCCSTSLSNNNGEPLVSLLAPATSTCRVTPWPFQFFTLQQPNGPHPTCKFHPFAKHEGESALARVSCHP